MVKRNESLDFLRGLAIILVLFRHLPVKLSFLPEIIYTIFSRVKAFGYIGVDLFFVLSGFLVSGLYFSKINSGKSPEVGKFLTRRAFKIWPSYYLYLLIMMIYLYFSKGIDVAWSSLGSAVFHIQNYLLTDKLHLWSLAIEEHFYTLLSLIVFILAKKNVNNFKKNILFIVSICSFIPMVMRLIFVDHHTYMTHMRSDGLFIGVFISAVYHFYSSFFDSLKKYQLILFILGMVLLSPTIYFIDIAYSGYWIRAFAFLLLHLGFGLILICSLNSGNFANKYIFRSPLGKIFQRYGFLSYGIYLWHFDFNGAFHFFVKKLSFNLDGALFGSLSFLVYFFGVYLLGVGLMNFIEKPFLKIREKYTA